MNGWADPSGPHLKAADPTHKSSFLKKGKIEIIRLKGGSGSPKKKKSNKNQNNFFKRGQLKPKKKKSKKLNNLFGRGQLKRENRRYGCKTKIERKKKFISQDVNPLSCDSKQTIA